MLLQNTLPLLEEEEIPKVPLNQEELDNILQRQPTTFEALADLLQVSTAGLYERIHAVQPLSGIYSEEDLRALHAHYQDRRAALWQTTFSFNGSVPKEVCLSHYVKDYTLLTAHLPDTTASRPLSTDRAARLAHLTPAQQETLLEAQHWVQGLLETPRRCTQYTRNDGEAIRTNHYYLLIVVASLLTMGAHPYARTVLEEEMGYRSHPITLATLPLWQVREQQLPHIPGSEADLELRKLLSRTKVALLCHLYDRTLRQWETPTEADGHYLFPSWMLASPLEEDVRETKSLQELAEELLVSYLAMVLRLYPEALPPTAWISQEEAQRVSVSNDNNNHPENLFFSPLALGSWQSWLPGTNRLWLRGMQGLSRIGAGGSLRTGASAGGILEMRALLEMLQAASFVPRPMDQMLLEASHLCYSEDAIYGVNRPLISKEYLDLASVLLTWSEPFLLSESLAAEAARNEFFAQRDAALRDCAQMHDLVRFLDVKKYLDVHGNLLTCVPTFKAYPGGSINTIFKSLAVPKEKLPPSAQWLPQRIPFLYFSSDAVALPYFLLRDYSGVVKILFPLQDSTRQMLSRLYGAEDLAVHPLRSYSPVVSTFLSLGTSKHINEVLAFYALVRNDESAISTIRTSQLAEMYRNAPSLVLEGEVSLLACLTGDTSICPKGGDRYTSFIPSRLSVDLLASLT